MKKTWNRSTMRFASAKYAPRQKMLDVTFENGDRFFVAVESVLFQATIGMPVDWAKIRIGATGDVIEVPARDTTIEIPWDRIRSLIDPDFRTHLADVAAESARRIGARVRSMRLDAKLTRRELATKIEVPQNVIANLEAGKTELSLDLIEKIALALGMRLRDFAAE
jgi:DNA-binding XRE family transcriptional regulator